MTGVAGLIGFIDAVCYSFSWSAADRTGVRRAKQDTRPAARAAFPPTPNSENQKLDP